MKHHHRPWKHERRSWNPEERRRYLDTLLSKLPAVIASTSRPLMGIGLIVGMMNHQPISFIQSLLKLVGA